MKNFFDNYEYFADIREIAPQSWTKYMGKCKESKQNWTRAEHFYICFFMIGVAKNLFLKGRLSIKATSSPNFMILVIFSIFLNLTLFGNSPGDLYTNLIMLKYQVPRYFWRVKAALWYSKLSKYYCQLRFMFSIMI